MRAATALLICGRRVSEAPCAFAKNASIKVGYTIEEHQKTLLVSYLPSSHGNNSAIRIHLDNRIYRKLSS